METEMVGKAQTVLGLLDPDSFDATLPHEHFYTIQRIESTFLRLRSASITRLMS